MSLWNGVLVAITTPFDVEFRVDSPELVRHARWMVDRGIDGIIAGGSLGEGSTLSIPERADLVRELVGAVPSSVPVIAAVAAGRTTDAVEQARDAARAGARGLLVLPPYVYRGDTEETDAHFAAVFEATDLPCMLYNNPPAYGTDVRPEHLASLAARHPTLTGVKESSGDAGRIAELVATLGDRLAVSVGLDESIRDGLRAGAVGWVAGLANGLPEESMALFRSGRAGDFDRLDALYRWFLPLLEMDTGPKFVQKIKLVRSELGQGTPRVRLPRLELRGVEREAVLRMLETARAHRPALEPGLTPITRP
jgi:1-pyrroline-4-hydroxy-2-carboxylate deaminase